MKDLAACVCFGMALLIGLVAAGVFGIKWPWLWVLLWIVGLALCVVGFVLLDQDS